MDRSGDELHLLLHAFRQRFDLGALPLAESHAVEPPDSLLARGRRAHPAQLAKEDDDVQDRHLLVETPLFGKIADTPQHAAIGRRIRAEYADLTAITRDDVH